jgi:hypothetical protein
MVVPMNSAEMGTDPCPVAVGTDTVAYKYPVPLSAIDTTRFTEHGSGLSAVPVHTLDPMVIFTSAVDWIDGKLATQILMCLFSDEPESSSKRQTVHGSCGGTETRPSSVAILGWTLEILRLSKNSMLKTVLLLSLLRPTFVADKDP